MRLSALRYLRYSISFVLCAKFVASSFADEPQGDGHHAQGTVASRLGVVYAEYIPPLWQRPRKTCDNPPKPLLPLPLEPGEMHLKPWVPEDFYPGRPPQNSPPPAGWMLALNETGILAQAGFSRGDVVIKIRDKEISYSRGDLSATIKEILSAKGSCTLTIRHFEKEYWNGARECKKEWFTDRQVIILPLRE
jgi:hypothetical protein